jgi:hypothetical protein
MSRDKRLNRTQEVDGSSPFSSTNPSTTFAMFGLTTKNASVEFRV